MIQAKAQCSRKFVFISSRLLPRQIISSNNISSNISSNYNSINSSNSSFMTCRPALAFGALLRSTFIEPALSPF